MSPEQVIMDGLQVLLKSIQLDVSSVDLPGPLLRLSVEALQTFPCSVRGDKINQPQDVYEFCDPCARLFRLVQIDGLRLAALSHKPGAMVEVIGQVTAQVEQRRWCGFIPQHRSRRVCPFSSETSISIRLPSVALQLQLEPIMALCEVLIHLIKSGMTADNQNEVEEALSPSPEQAIWWSEAQQGSAGATGLQWREQLLRRKNVSLLSLSLTLVHCGATLCLEPKAVQLEAHDFMFTLDLISTLDAFRWRCLHELGLIEKGQEGAKMCGLQRLFGIYLGSAKLLWSTLGSADLPSTLLSLGGEPRAAPCLTFKWKDLPLHSPCESLQPMEGCVHSVKLCVNTSAIQQIIHAVKNVVMPFTQLLQPPPFAVEWCRVRVHELTVQIPQVGRLGAPATLRMPSLLLTSLEGLGQLFTSLESLPSRHVWQSSSSGHVGLPDAAMDTAGVLCACGRHLGTTRFGSGFTPLRGTGTERAWRIRQTKTRDHVPVGYNEFLDMIQAQVSAGALFSLLPSLETEMPGESLEGLQLEISPSSTSKKKSRSWLSGFKRERSKSGANEGKAPELAKEWASLQEAIRRLSRQREELQQRHLALRRSADEEMQLSRSRASEVEDELALKIALERGKQAELSAQAEEQRQLLVLRLRERQGRQL
ncbi:unnamed protein product [Cladocopium goreaui]|uniref:Translation initiation factor IF-2 n=1 Tax=Cladocopium goreaui TaxID=2562237 RepID=A0A9P1BG18_9DINO|nr:unnamed protein product [Cladocopium goreaui]